MVSQAVKAVHAEKPALQPGTAADAAGSAPSRRRRAPSRMGVRARPILVGIIAVVGCMLGLALVAPSPAGAEIYRWTDEQGRLHFAQDLSQVPPRYRRMADAAAKSKADEPREPLVQTFSPPPASLETDATARRGSGPKSSADVHRVRVARAGSSMRANVLINGDLMVPFILDTGATDVVLPEWAANELGLDLSQSRTAFYRTANGMISSKLTTLESVKLGSAEVRGVPASISTSMQTGLLGLSFFNHFKYNFDPTSGVVTLTENDLAESGTLKGGRSEEQWRSAFRAMHGRIAAGQKMLDEAPSSRMRRKAEIEEALDGLRRELELLEGEADDARVPFAWRD
jgi:clan AA aspartic protease (TIGR02281 family)